MSVNCVPQNLTPLKKLLVVLSVIVRIFFALIGALLMLPVLILCLLKYFCLFGFVWCVFDAFFFSRFF